LRNDLQERFFRLLETESKDDLISFISELLQQEKMKVFDIYDELLIPSLNEWFCQEKEQRLCVWREHVRSSIIRAIIEISYIYLLKERKELLEKGELVLLNKRVSIVCPSEEYHEIGARIVADYFYMNGYDVLFVGGNTPKNEYVDAIDIIKTDYIAISVTNPYNIIITQKTIEHIRNEVKAKNIKQPIIIVGGKAFYNKEHIAMQIGADKVLHSYEDIKALAEVDRK